MRLSGSWWSAGALPPCDGVVIPAGVVLVPISLRPLEEFKVILHFAFDERLDGYGAFDLMLGEAICIKLIDEQDSYMKRAGKWLTLKHLEIL